MALVEHGNKAEAKRIDSLRGDERNLLKLVLKAREMEWQYVLDGMQDTLKAFKESNYKDTSLFDEEDYEKALSEMVLKDCDVFDISSFRRTELQALALDFIFAYDNCRYAAEIHFPQKTEDKYKLFMICRSNSKFVVNDIFLIANENAKVHSWLQKEVFDGTDLGLFQVDLKDLKKLPIVFKYKFKTETLLDDLVEFPRYRLDLSCAVSSKLGLTR